VLALEEQSPSKQMELCDVQADSFMRGKRRLHREVPETKRLCTWLLCIDGQVVRVWKLVFRSEPHKVEDEKSTWQPDVVSMYTTCSDWNPVSDGSMGAMGAIEPLKRAIRICFERKWKSIQWQKTFSNSVHYVRLFMSNSHFDGFEDILAPKSGFVSTASHWNILEGLEDFACIISDL